MISALRLSPFNWWALQFTPVDRRSSLAGHGDEYRPDIDGLRSLAVMAVVVFHAFPGRLIGGFAGVDVFFVISGFLITGILVREADAGRLSIAGFYARRVRRIFPALITVLVAVMAAGWFVLLADDYATLGTHVAAAAGFVANLMFWSEASYFDVSAISKPLLHLWSLGVEEQFYFIWPLVLALVVARRGNLGTVVGLIGAVSLIASVILVATSPTAAFFSPVSRFWELVAGASIVAFQRSGRALYGPIATGASSVGLLLVAATFLYLPESAPFPGLAALPPIVGTCLLIAAGPAAFVNRRLLSLPIPVGIGLISYPLYLWHWPLLSFASIVNFNEALPGAVRLALVMASIALAWLTYRFIEQPVRRASPATMLIAMAAVLAAGVAILAANGLPRRPVNQDERRSFVAFYQDMRRNGLASYRPECDFVDWGTLINKTAIERSCTRAGAGGTVFLWGDSHAQAFAGGLSQAIPRDVALAQVATSGCRPDTRFNKAFYPNPNLRAACDRSNRHALGEIARIKPDLVVIAQGGEHLAQDWESLGAHLRRNGARSVVLLGPLPQWRPSLPLVVTRQHWPLTTDRLATGLDRSVLANDRILSSRAASWRSLGFISVIDQLCDTRGCLARVPGSLIAVDYGHLSPSGSEYVGSAILSEPITAMIADNRRRAVVGKDTTTAYR